MMQWTYVHSISIGLTVMFNVGCGQSAREPAVEDEEPREIQSNRELSLVQEIASLCGVEVADFGGFKVSSLALDAETMDPSAVNYFCSVIPDVSIRSELLERADLYRLCDRASLEDNNRNYVPSCFIIEAGFVTIGHAFDGDAVALDVTDGSVYLVPHETDWETELGDDPMARRGKVVKEATRLASTIGEFLEAWRDELREITDVEEARRREAETESLTFVSGSRFSFDTPWLIKSIQIPDGHHTSTGFEQKTIWIKRDGEDSSVVVSSVSIQNSLISEAFDPSGPYVDMEVAGTVWRFKRGPWPSFEAILLHNDEAAFVYGGLAWTDEGIREFLARLQLGEDSLSNGQETTDDP